MNVTFENTPAGWSSRASTAAPWEACGWSRAGQMVRHMVVIERLAPRPGETLVDYGCGTGDLTAHIPADVNYLGFDWAGGMVERAQGDHPSRVFTTVEPDWPVRLVACVGPFNLADGWSKPQTWETLERLWGLTMRALAVCLYAGNDERCIRYLAGEVAQFAERLTGAFTLERGYLPNDLLLVMRR